VAFSKEVKKNMRIVSCLIVATFLAWCQSFEVATVKRGERGDYGARGSSDPMRFSVENYPMSSLLEMAYGINSYQLSGPGWLDSERFTVTAKHAEGATSEQLNLMLRTLLIERFKIAAHFDKKDVTGYRLVVARGGSKLAAPPPYSNQDDGPSQPPAPLRMTVDQEGFPQLPPGRHFAMAIANDRTRWRFADESMDHFAETLGSQIHQPIVNATGLTGGYDFVVSWSAAELQPNAPSDSGPTIFAAIQEQLGLKLESARIAVNTLVIDHMERTPAEN
jgi:uncharacterized protein (TIGR03435 family)